MTPLEAAYDALTETLAHAEKVFRDQRFCVRAEISLTDDGAYLPVFARAANRWGLWCRKEGSLTPPETEGLMPLRDVQVDLRIRAARALPRLYEALRARKDEKTAEVYVVIADLNAFLRPLEEPRATDP